MTFYKHLYRALAFGSGHVTAPKFCLFIIIIIIIINITIKKKEAKEQLLTRVKKLLKITTDLPIRPQMKMNILKKFIYSHLTDSLKKILNAAHVFESGSDFLHLHAWGKCFRCQGACVDLAFLRLKRLVKNWKSRGDSDLKTVPILSFNRSGMKQQIWTLMQTGSLAEMKPFMVQPEFWNPPSKHQLRITSSLSKFKELQQRPSPRTYVATTSAYGIKWWTACLKISSGLLAKPCSKCCQPIPILPWMEKFYEFELWSVWRIETDEQARSLQLFSLPRTLQDSAQKHASGDRKLDPRSQIPKQHSLRRYWFEDFEHFSANRQSIPVHDSTRSRVVRCIHQYQVVSIFDIGYSL